MTKTKILVTSIFAVFYLFLASNLYAVESIIINNASDSENSIGLQSTKKSTVTTSNNSKVTNTIQVEANTGSNKASANEDSVNIQTGDSNVSFSVTNSPNTTSVDQSGCCGTVEITEISENGSASENMINSQRSLTNDVSVTNNARVTNDLSIKANTGDNQASFNNGQINISTGDVNSKTKIANLQTNSTLVNQSTDEVSRQEKIAQNGSGSQNSINESVSNTINIDINSDAELENKVSETLNTGKNTANKNIGGVNIMTGNIFSMLRLINGPINFNKISLECCSVSDPGSYPTQEDDEDIPEEKDKDKKRQEESTFDDQAEGSLLSDAASTQNSGEDTKILGLSDTSSDSSRSLFFFAGLIFITFGIKALGDYTKERLSNCYSE